MTIYQRFQETALKNLARPVVYWKKGKNWQHQNYGDFLKTVDNLAGGLSELGISKDSKLAILSENRPEWLACDLAINKSGAVCVPIHATSNPSLVSYIIKDSQSSIMFISGSLLEKHQEFLKQLSSEKPDLKLVCFDQKNDSPDGKIYSYSELIRNKPALEPVVSDLASIVYTSGTTGEPKGVMLSNTNFLNNIDGTLKEFDINSNDKFLSFLPLSHVMERTLGSYIPVMVGASIAYAESIQRLAKNLKEVKPTIIIGVPRIYEKTKQKIFAGMHAKNALVKKMFFLSLKKDDGTLLKKVADKLIYKKIRQVFGGRLRFAVSGGAAIHERILRFYNTVGIRIVEGYGLTETSPIIACNTLEKRVIGTVGRALPGIEIKIGPDKEVMTKSPCVMMGYWGKDEVTKEVIEDGWFKTGDLGFIDGDKLLTIIGRKKDIIVTSNGKNIYPEKIENAINLSPFIIQSVVVGHRKDHLAALVVPNMEAIQENFKEEKVDVTGLIKKEVEKANQLGHDYEQVKSFELLEQPFVIEKDELTPTLKLRRHVIESKYNDLIEKMYK